MNFVIPMAGKGQRFINAGYNLPKMLIEAKGKTLLEWSIDSLPLDLCTKLIFIGLYEHEVKYKISDFIKKKYTGKWELITLFIEETTGGQAETVLKAESQIDKRNPLLIFNIDTCFKSKDLKDKLVLENIDGVLGSFKDNSSRFSFAQINKNGIVTRVTEKEPISHHALTGLYFFSQACDFIETASELIRNNETIKGEFYIAPMYNKLIQKKKKYILDICDEHYILGTPDELSSFINL